MISFRRYAAIRALRRRRYVSAWRLIRARLEAKGYLRRETNPADRRSRLLYATHKAEELKNSKAHLEELFYEWLLEPLNAQEQEELARLLAVLEPRCREEWRAGFPNVEERLAAEKAREQGGSPV